MEITIPIISVVAKPFTVPLPKKNRTAAAISVVTLPSRIAGVALLKPAFSALRRLLPRTSSSFTRSKITIFASTAIPTESTIPAIPGNVSVTWNRLSATSSKPI